MGFTTNTFIFLFFPLSVILYFLFYKAMVRKQNFFVGNVILSLLSFIFYAWTFATNAVMLFFYVLVIYVLGYIVYELSPITVGIPYYSDKNIKEKKFRVSILFLIVGLVCTIGILYHFKYAGVISTVISKYVYIDPNKYAGIMAPLGISFITFSAITYLVDIYRGEATPGSLLDCLLFISFFPKVVSGPIIAWMDFQPQIKNRKINTQDFVNGINRICIGFGKKVIIADTLGLYASKIADVQIDTISAWFGWILYAMQLYYDFAGYSDVAIGVSKIFGFQFTENFNFPYCSVSVSEFWRRWHISLGAFFRNYLYIPLGGNRKGYKRTLINLGIIFTVTGIWHGAGLAYIVWGALHGFCVIIERVISNKIWYVKTPKIIKWIGTFVICVSAWQFFRYGDFLTACTSFTKMFGIHFYTSIPYPWNYYIDSKAITFLIIALVGATILGSQKVQRIYKKLRDHYAFYIAQEVVTLGIFVLSVIFMMSSTYSPFIYFQF